MPTQSKVVLWRDSVEAATSGMFLGCFEDAFFADVVFVETSEALSLDLRVEFLESTIFAVIFAHSFTAPSDGSI